MDYGELGSIWAAYKLLGGRGDFSHEDGTFVLEGSYSYSKFYDEDSVKSALLKSIINLANEMLGVRDEDLS